MVWAPQLRSASLFWTSTTTTHNSFLSQSALRFRKVFTHPRHLERCAWFQPQTLTLEKMDVSPSLHTHTVIYLASERWEDFTGTVADALSAYLHALYNFYFFFFLFQDGTLLVIGELDRETQDVYDVVIAAMDHAVPPRIVLISTYLHYCMMWLLIFLTLTVLWLKWLAHS